MISDSAIYVDGKRTESPDLEGIRRACTERGGFAWVELAEPDDEELASVAREFGLPETASGEISSSPSGTAGPPLWKASGETSNAMRHFLARGQGPCCGP